jgi:uncharacterized protein with FMN-binding domain
MAYEPPKRPIAPPTRRPSRPPSPPTAAKAKSGSGKNKKIANSLVALSSAAILSVYGLGYIRTDAAQALYNLDAPTIPIATAAPTAINAPSSSVAAYQSPLFPSPTATAATAGGSAQGAATATTAQPTATTAAATSAPSPTAQTPATIAATATKAPAVATSTPATTALYKDGTYSGTGTSRHGNIAASVVVQGGKIVSAAITQCGTRYPCSDIAALPGEVVSRQSAAVDYVSGATDSSQAYRGAIQNALAKAKGAA